VDRLELSALGIFLKAHPRVILHKGTKRDIGILFGVLRPNPRNFRHPKPSPEKVVTSDPHPQSAAAVRKDQSVNQAHYSCSIGTLYITRYL
jgi:hypothetical protein